MSVEVDIMSPTSDQNAKSLSSRWESKMKTHQLKDNVWRYEAGKTTKEKIYYLLWVKELHWHLNLVKLYGAMKRFHPSTPKISLVHVILLTVFDTILMMLGEITVESTKNPQIDSPLGSHYLPAWYCIDIERRNSVSISIIHWS